MPASDFSTNQVSVGSTATLIVAQNHGRLSVLITNLGTTAIYIGDSPSVTTSNGQLLPGVVGASISLPVTCAIYGISSGAAQSVSFCDI
jgi:hypothetical protein